MLRQAEIRYIHYITINLFSELLLNKKKDFDINLWMSNLEHDALEDSLMADLAGVMAAQVEEGDGGAIRIPVRQDGELPLTQLRLQRPAAVIKEAETLAKSEINVIVSVEVL